IIEGAHEGKGLGVRFLRHIERNSCLLFLIPADADDIKKQYKILEKELKLYNRELVNKPRMIGISKSDLLDDELIEMLKKELPKKIPHVFFSSMTNKNIMELKDMLWKMMNS
ncbi:MAG TPA: GTPase ObgE, partial [Chitinophagales bacterium]|nr:GTPase ObgE [Chitinophagales bacterium]